MKRLLLALALVISNVPLVAHAQGASVDSCTLLTTGDVASASGLKVGRQTHVQDTGACQYRLESTNIVGTYITVLERPGDGTAFAGYLQSAKAQYGSSYVAMPGVGERAAHDDNGVAFLKHGRYVVIAIHGGMSIDQRVDLAKKLAVTAASRV